MAKFRRWLFRLSAYRIAVIVGVLFTAASVFRGNRRIDQLPVIGQIENILHDLKLKERGVITPSGDVVIVAADEKAIHDPALGRWQFPREKIATMVDKLTALGAKAIVFDIAYIDPVPEDRLKQAAELKDAFAQLKVGLLPLAALSAPDSSKAVLEKIERYEAKLAEKAGTRTGDQQLGDSVRKSSRVVLGSLLLSPNEMKGLSPEEARKGVASVSHVRIQFPTLDPTNDEGDELVVESKPNYDVRFHTYLGANAPLDELMRTEGKNPKPSLSFFNTSPDADGVVRREPLVLAVGDPRNPHDRFLLVPNIDLAGVMKFYDADAGATRLWTASEATDQLEYVAVLPGSANPTSGPPKKSSFKKIPVDPQGELLLNYYGPDGSFPLVSMADVYHDRAPRSAIAGKIILMAATATGTFDQRITPFSPLSPGVEIHATAMENILHGQYLVRPWWATVVESLILLLIALLVGRLLTKVPVVWGLPVMIATAAGYHLFDFTMFKSGISLFSAVPMIEVAAIYVLQTIYRYSTEEAEKRHIRRAFQFYLNKSVIEEMLQDPSKLKLGGDKKVLSVMFSDIRGFTTISEKLTPEGLAKLINEYLTPMTNLVFETGGTLDKYIGDALMAIWGAPLDQPDHAYRACKTAVAMMRQLALLQQQWKDQGLNYPPIDIGIGINSGPMVVGNMGADQRFDYTVLGDNVNLASRLEGTNKDYRSHIIISQNTYDLCKGQIAAMQLGAVRVKGKKEPVAIYELHDDKPATGELAEVIALFDKAVALFQEQRWEACREQCRAVLARWPDYGPPHAYIEFCDEYEKHPPGTQWDGVYTMMHK